MNNIKIKTKRFITIENMVQFLEMDSIFIWIRTAIKTERVIQILEEAIGVRFRLPRNSQSPILLVNIIFS